MTTAIVNASRVKETSTTTGLGAYSLAGAATGFQTFVAGVGNGGLCAYEADDGTNWEVGIGTVTAGGPDTLARTAILQSSNADAAVNWGAGTKTLIVTLPGERYPELTSDPSLSPPLYASYGASWLDLANAILYTFMNDGAAGVWAELGPEGNPDMADLFKMLAADDTGQNIATVQPWFPTAGGVTVLASTTYRVTGLLHLTRAAGATSHTTSIGIGGTASLTSMRGYVLSNTGDVLTTLAAGMTLMNAATAAVCKAASTSTTEEAYFICSWIIRVNATGTIIPQFTYSAIPGGAPTVRTNSFFYATPVGTNNATVQGLWG